MKIVLAAVLFFGLALAAQANDAVIKLMKGPVSVKPVAGKKWIPAKPGQKLKRNDQIRTGPSALVQLDFSRATLLVKENSRFSLRSDARGSLVSFRIGEFLIGLRKKEGKPERFRVRTPTAVAAVRGTVFWGQSDEAQLTRYACFTGSIEVWGKGKNVVLEPGQMTSIALNEFPAEPAANNLPATYVDTFKIGDSLGGIERLLTQ